MAYIPGSGFKKPLNMLESPIYPDIKQGPPIFKWTRKNWKVDMGRTMAEVEHIPQLQESSVLFQSKDYNSQHAYGNYPTYTTVVNKEFRPPLIGQEDILPLSRLPRPLVVPRINPGTAHSGNTAFAEQNTSLSNIERFISDRVKEGEIRPTFFAPLSAPVDNTVLPDLETKMPNVSASAGFKYPEARSKDPNVRLDFRKINPDARTGTSTLRGEAQFISDPMQDIELEYSNPQVSATAGTRTLIEGFTPIEHILNYKTPQVSATSGKSTLYRANDILDVPERELEYSRPQISVSSGSKLSSARFDSEFTRVEELHTKLAGSQSVLVTPKMTSLSSPEDGYQKGANIQPDKIRYSYNIPKNTTIRANNTSEREAPYRTKTPALMAGNKANSTGNAIPTKHGATNPNHVIKKRKDM